MTKHGQQAYSALLQRQRDEMELGAPRWKTLVLSGTYLEAHAKAVKYRTDYPSLCLDPALDTKAPDA